MATNRGKANRLKGHNFEREVARWLRELFPEAKRGIQTREGFEAPDVDCRALWVECKRGAKVSATSAMRQAMDANEKSGGTRMPVVVWKADREPMMVAMEAEDWKEVLEGWLRWSNG